MEFITAIYNALAKATVVNTKKEEEEEETKGEKIRENDGDRGGKWNIQFFTYLEDTV